MAGYIKLHRKILNSDFFKKLTGRQRDVIYTILLMADHEGKEWKHNGKIYKTSPGQVFSSLEQICQNCGKDCTKSVVRSTLYNAQNAQFLTLETHKTHTLITIENWGKYQDCNTENAQNTHEKHTENARFSATNKNIRNKEIKKYVETDIELKLATLLFNLIRSNNKTFKEPNLQQWAEQINKCIRLDNRNPDDIEAVIRFAQKNDFWKSNILSASKLRSKFDTLYMQMPRKSEKVVPLRGNTDVGNGIQFY